MEKRARMDAGLTLLFISCQASIFHRLFMHENIGQIFFPYGNVSHLPAKDGCPFAVTAIRSERRLLFSQHSLQHRAHFQKQIDILFLLVVCVGKEMRCVRICPVPVK